MAAAPIVANPYDYRWRTYERPAALVRYFHECRRCSIPDRPMGLRSNLHGCHIDGNPWNRAESNIVIMCRTCHKKHDHPLWLACYRRFQASAEWEAYLKRRKEKSLDRKDEARPILTFLKRGMAAQAAVDSIVEGVGK